MNRIILIFSRHFLHLITNADDDIVFTANSIMMRLRVKTGGKYGVATIADEHLTWINDVEACVAEVPTNDIVV